MKRPGAGPARRSGAVKRNAPDFERSREFRKAQRRRAAEGVPSTKYWGTRSDKHHCDAGPRHLFRDTVQIHLKYTLISFHPNRTQPRLSPCLLLTHAEFSPAFRSQVRRNLHSRPSCSPVSPRHERPTWFLIVPGQQHCRSLSIPLADNANSNRLPFPLLVLSVIH